MVWLRVTRVRLADVATPFDTEQTRLKEETRKKEERTGEKMRRGEKSRVKNRRDVKLKM